MRSRDASSTGAIPFRLPGRSIRFAAFNSAPIQQLVTLMWAFCSQRYSIHAPTARKPDFFAPVSSRGLPPPPHTFPRPSNANSKVYHERHPSPITQRGFLRTGLLFTSDCSLLPGICKWPRRSRHPGATRAAGRPIDYRQRPRRSAASRAWAREARRWNEGVTIASLRSYIRILHHVWTLLQSAHHY